MATKKAAKKTVDKSKGTGLRGQRVETEQRRKYILEICQIYSNQTVTIESACKSVGVSVRAFADWCAGNAEFAELYKNAQASHVGNYREQLKEKARTSLMKRVEGYTVEEIEQIAEIPTGKKGSAEKDANQAPKVTRVKHTKKHIAPDVTAIIFALKNMDGDNFKDTYNTEITGANQGPVTFISEHIMTLNVEQLFMLRHGRKPKPGEIELH